MANINRRAQKGQALVTALIFLLALTFLGFGLITMSTIDINASRNARLAEEALVAAEQGAFFALAWAANPHTEFYEFLKGDSVTLDSITNAGKLTSDRSHWQVRLVMGGKTEAPLGYAEGKGGYELVKVTFMQVFIYATGMVQDSPGATINFTKRPRIIKTVEMIASIERKE